MATTRKRARTRDTETDTAKMVDAALRLAAVQGWRDTTLAEVAAEADLDLSTARRAAPSKFALLAAFVRRIDDAVLEGTDNAIGEEPVRDRLFDIIMRRFDAMAPHKTAIAAIWRDMRYDPPFAACFAHGPRRRSLVWMLEAARIASWGPLRNLQVEGLGIVYLGAFRAWIEDDSEDLGKTMSALDKGLGRADSLARWLQGLRRGRQEATADASEA